MGLDTIHWISSGLASFARGTNDAPKIVAILFIGNSATAWPDSSSQLAAFGGIAIAMGLGSYLGGLRVTEVLAEKVTKMNHAEGLSANLTTSTPGPRFRFSRIAGLDYPYQQFRYYRHRPPQRTAERAMEDRTRHGPGLDRDATCVSSPRCYRLPYPHQNALACLVDLVHLVGVVQPNNQTN